MGKMTVSTDGMPSNMMLGIVSKDCQLQASLYNKNGYYVYLRPNYVPQAYGGHVGPKGTNLAMPSLQASQDVCIHYEAGVLTCAVNDGEPVKVEFDSPISA